MNYVAADVKKLREETGATFADCKNALTDAANWDEALKIIDAKRDRKAEKMQVADRETKQGGIFSAFLSRFASMILSASSQFAASVKAFLQSANVAPVSSRNFFTSAAT